MGEKKKKRLRTNLTSSGEGILADPTYSVSEQKNFQPKAGNGG